MSNVLIIASKNSLRERILKATRAVLCPETFVFHTLDDYPNSVAWLNSTNLLISIEGEYEKSVRENEHLKKYIDEKRLHCCLREEEKDIEESIFAELNRFGLTDARSVKKTSIDTSEPVTAFDGTLADRFSTCFVNFSTENKLLSSCENDGKNESSFNFSKFFAASDCKELGQRVIHFPTISSTEDVFGNKSEDWKGLVVVADSQIAGKGRKKNQWISPGGSLAMSFGFEVDLGLLREYEHLAAIQHLVGLSAVSALRELSKSENVFCKWPNDIYWKREIKLGGIISRASFMGRILTVCVGIGVNLKNEKPFPGACVLTETEISREELMAKIFNNVEENLPKLKDGSWRNEYESLWLHSSENVKFEGMKGVVKGVDMDGFLLVENENGEGRVIFASIFVLTIDTDNNSFDLMEGLIHSKR